VWLVAHLQQQVGLGVGVVADRLSDRPAHLFCKRHVERILVVTYLHTAPDLYIIVSLQMLQQLVLHTLPCCTVAASRQMQLCWMHMKFRW
jgi:hypothetical protein